MKLYSGPDGSYEIKPSPKPGYLCVRFKARYFSLDYDLTPEQAKTLAAQLEDAADFVLLKGGHMDNG